VIGSPAAVCGVRTHLLLSVVYTYVCNACTQASREPFCSIDPPDQASGRTYALFMLSMDKEEAAFHKCVAT